MPKCVVPMLVVAGLLCSLLIPAGASNFPQGPSIPFKTVIAGTTSHITRPATKVIRDNTAWVALWRRHTGSDHGAPPPVDFSRDMLAAVFGGTSTEPTTAGIVRITREPTGLVVWYSVQARRPGPPGEVSASAPFQIVTFTRSTMPVTFHWLKTQEILRQGP